MKKILFNSSLVLLVFLFNFNAYAQEPDWTLLEEQNGVKIYRAYITCEERPYVLVKIENLNKSEVTVNWKSKFMMMGKDILTEDAKSVTVAPLSTSTGDCQSSSLKINPLQFVSMLRAGVSDYSISDLTIN
jgi:hypothetical protein